MACKAFVLASIMMTAASAAIARQSAPAPVSVAPAAAADARYCLRVDPATGSRIETIRCETRETWAQLDVDVDQEWAQWGVRIVGPDRLRS
jgi:hypothetical protein